MPLGGRPDAAEASSAFLWFLLGFSLGAGGLRLEAAGSGWPSRPGGVSGGSTGGAFSVSVADEALASDPPAPRGPAVHAWPAGLGPGAVQVRVFQEVPGPDGPTYVQTTGQVVSISTGRGDGGSAGP